MTRHFIYQDTGEFGFTHFHEYKDNKWTWLNLEVDCDLTTLDNFKNDNTLNFQFWLSDDSLQLCIASNCLGLKRQANIPIIMLRSFKLTLTEPAKGGGEFDLSIDGDIYRGEIIKGKINVEYKEDSNWDFNDFKKKSKILEQKTDSLIQLTGGQITMREKFINA